MSRTSTSDQLAAGQLIGDYKVASVAGSGGMGLVYRATQQSLGRVVALKVIREEIASAPEYRERFLREARLAASVDHPNIVTVYDVGDQDSQLFLAMQWIDGEDLKQVLERSGRLVPNRAVAIVTQVAGALDAVHSIAGLVHRDVKPSNVLVGQVAGKDHAYLTDFGVAKPSGAADQLTRTGWVVGTAGYLSPEQIRGQEPGPRSDLYALGCLFFEALTGQAPFRGENEMALRWAHANDPRPRASVLLPALGSRYDEFLAVALAIEPEGRFASGREFGAALAAAHSGESAPAGEGTAATAMLAVPRTPTAIGPPTPMPPPPHTPQPPPPAGYPAYGYGTPPPAAPHTSRAGNPLALILLALVAFAGIAAGALAATGVLSKGAATHTTTSAAAAKAVPALKAAEQKAAAKKENVLAEKQEAVKKAREAAAARKQAVEKRKLAEAIKEAHVAALEAHRAKAETEAPKPSAGLLPGTVTGVDSSGHTIGVDCSDNESNPLRGCYGDGRGPSYNLSYGSATGRDSEGYVIGVGCSANPATPLPRCEY